MAWEYRQLEVKTRGFFTARLPDSCFAELNALAREGWQVDKVLRLTRAFGRTDAVSFLLKRETKSA